MFRLQAPSPQVNTETLASAGELAFVEQAHSRQPEDNERSGLLFGRGEKGRNARLVVVLQEMGAMINELLRSGKKMALNCGCVLRYDVVVESLVGCRLRTASMAWLQNSAAEAAKEEG